MALLTIVDAVRLTGVSRIQLYCYLKAGRISRTPEGCLDTAELLRAGLMLRLPDETPTVSVRHEETPSVSSDASVVSLTMQERLIEILQRELDAARLLLREAHERETQLIQMLSQMQQQNQRLLDMPRTPVPLQTAQDAPGATQTREPPGRAGDSARACRCPSHLHRRGMFEGRCADVSWPCSRRILKASAPPRCAPCSE